MGTLNKLQLMVEKTKSMQTDKFKPDYSKQPRLSLWGDDERGMPNTLIRSPLFSAAKLKRDRKNLHREKLFTFGSLEVIYTGAQLDQLDEDVWSTLIHFARLQFNEDKNLNEKIRIDFSLNSFLKKIKRRTGKEQHDWLKSVFARLGATWIEVKINEQTVMTSLISEIIVDERTGKHIAFIDRKIIRLYESCFNSYTKIDFDMRSRLGKNLLAKWLFDHYQSHKNPYPLKVETFHRLSGSNNNSMEAFKQKLCEAHKSLAEIGAITSWGIENDLVHVEKCSTFNNKNDHLPLKKISEIIGEK